MGIAKRKLSYDVATAVPTVGWGGQLLHATTLQCQRRLRAYSLISHYTLRSIMQ